MIDALLSSADFFVGWLAGGSSGCLENIWNASSCFGFNSTIFGLDGSCYHIK